MRMGDDEEAILFTLSKADLQLYNIHSKQMNYIA